MSMHVTLPRVQLGRWRSHAAFGSRVAAWLIAPALCNFALWASLMLPQQRRLLVAQEAQAFTTLRPRLDALVQHTSQTLHAWETTGFSQNDSSQVTQVIQRTADQAHIKITDLKTEPNGGKSPHAAFKTLGLQLTATGSFGKLARWLSDVESRSGFQVESCTLTSAGKPDEPHQFVVELTALLRGA